MKVSSSVQMSSEEKAVFFSEELLKTGIIVISYRCKEQKMNEVKKQNKQYKDLNKELSTQVRFCIFLTDRQLENFKEDLELAQQNALQYKKAFDNLKDAYESQLSGNAISYLTPNQNILNPRATRK
jgi:hypothetical protein